MLSFVDTGDIDVGAYELGLNHNRSETTWILFILKTKNFHFSFLFQINSPISYAAFCGTRDWSYKVAQILFHANFSPLLEYTWQRNYQSSWVSVFIKMFAVFFFSKRPLWKSSFQSVFPQNWLIFRNLFTFLELQLQPWIASTSENINIIFVWLNSCTVQFLLKLCIYCGVTS